MAIPLYAVESRQVLTGSELPLLSASANEPTLTTEKASMHVHAACKPKPNLSRPWKTATKATAARV